MQESWFDAEEGLDSDPLATARDRADRSVPFTEDDSRIKRSVSSEGTLTTALNAVSFVYLSKILSDSKVDRQTQEQAIIDYIKLAPADVFSFSSGLVEHMDPFKLVSGPYGNGVKGLLKTAGASVGIIFSALNFIEGVDEADLAKIASATVGTLGAISGVVLSGFTGFGVALFLMGGDLILDAISDTKQRGESDTGCNEFVLNDGNLPDVKQIGKKDEVLYYETLTGRQFITPSDVGALQNITFNTHPGSESKGCKGFQIRDLKREERASHLIYTSDAAIKDTAYIAHNNQGKDCIEGGGRFLEGDDTIFLRSLNARINAGEGDDIVFISGKEEIVEGGTGSNIAILAGNKGKMILSIFGDGHAVVGKMLLKNFSTYIFTGFDHEVIIDTQGLVDTIPIIACSGRGKIILRNPVNTNAEATVIQQGNTLRMPESNGFTYAAVLNSLSVGGKIIALQKGFSASIRYDR